MKNKKQDCGTPAKKKTNWKLVRELMHGYNRYIVLATISVVLSTAFSYAAPYVTSFTLDYVIQGISTSTPAFLVRWAEALGGRSYFVNSLYICGIALVVFTGLNCLFTYTRPRKHCTCLGRRCENHARPALSPSGRCAVRLS